MVQIMIRLLEESIMIEQEFESIIEHENVQPTEEELQKTKEQIKNQEKQNGVLQHN
jgi:hypothetical protein